MKSYTIDNKFLYVFDNLLKGQQLEVLIKRFYQASFTKNEIGRPDTANFPHWAHELDINSIQNEPFWQLTLQSLSQLPLKDRWRVYRAYVNAGVYGDTMFSHTDTTPERQEITVLWYIVPEWNIDWSGETLFYDKDDEIAYAAVPRPGRLVIFDSRIKHSGRPPSRICYHNRFTLALKMEKY